MPDISLKAVALALKGIALKGVALKDVALKGVVLKSTDGCVHVRRWNYQAQVALPVACHALLLTQTSTSPGSRVWCAAA